MLRWVRLFLTWKKTLKHNITGTPMVSIPEEGMLTIGVPTIGYIFFHEIQKSCNYGLRCTYSTR